MAGQKLHASMPPCLRGENKINTMLPLTRLRSETPGCAHRNHLNNAGAALQPLPVLRAVQDYLALEAEMGGYEAADLRAGEIAGFYQAVAKMLHTKARNIAFATSATDAYARALSAVPLRAGDVILTTENDYVSNQIAFLALQKRLGIQVLRAADLPEGGVDVADLERLVKALHPVLVAVTHVPTNSGLVQPVEAVGRICREHGIWYLVDACQSAGQMPLDVEKIGCDFLAATMRKFMRGPRGAGFLFASDHALEAGLEMLLPDMRGANWTGADSYEAAPDARRFEYWEMPPALVLGSRAAVEYALELGLEQIELRVRELAGRTRRLLAEIPGLRVLDHGAELCGIVTAHCPDWDPQALLQYLAARQINCRVSPLLVAQIDFPKKGVEWALRVSPHYYNLEEEIDEVAVALSQFRSA